MTKKNYLLLCSALFCFFIILQSAAFGQALGEIHMAIEKKGAKWQAGETSMTRLSPEERQKRLGLVLPEPTGKEPLLSMEESPLVQAPPSLDWRTNGGNFVTPARDQGGCGSCWAFAATAGLESNVLISNHTPGVDLDLSEQVMVSCGIYHGNCSGGLIENASEFFKITGLPVESCYPYTATNGSCANSCADWRSSTYKISNWQWVATYQPTVNGLKNALANYGPLVSTIMVYYDFFSYNGGVYSHVSGDLAGAHAVLIVGYDDPGQYFIAKNSWGSGWGESGFFRIGYSQLEGPVGFGRWSIGYVGAVPACSYNVTSPSTPFPGSGGNGSLSINTATTCPWNAFTNDSWITVTAGDSGSGTGTVSFSVSPNTGAARSAWVIVAGQYITIQQDAAPCTYSITPTQASLGAEGGSGSVTLNTRSGCPWNAVESLAWVNMTGTVSGFNYSVLPNTSPSSRTGTIAIAGLTFTINQEGSSCGYSISPASRSLSASAATGTVNVTASAGCTWGAASAVNWITVTSGSSGTGNGTVGYSVGGNSTIFSRSGTLTVAGKTFTVNQAGLSCAYTLSSTSQAFPASSGSGTVGVTSLAGCNWTAVSNAGWMTVNSGAMGSGNGQVGYSVAANTAASSRSGSLTVAGKTFTVAQEGLSCSYSISPASNSLGASGGTGSLTVASPAGCSWTAVSSVSWIMISSGTAGSGNGQVSYSVAGQSSTAPRTGTLTVAGKNFTVTQTGVNCTFALASTSKSFDGSGGTGTVNVNAPAGCAWNAASSAAWINISFGGSGSGGGQVGYTVAANTSPSSRAGTMTIAGQTFTVNQQAAPCVYSLSGAEQSFSSEEDEGVVSVNTANGCPWSASSQSSWITLTSGSSGIGSGAVQYTIEANTGSDLRTGNMTIGGKSFKVTQAGADSAPVIVVEPVLVDFGRVARGDTGSQPLKISNKGTAPLTIKGMRITSRTLGVFKSEGGCQTLAPGESCTLTLKFEPVSRGIIQGIMKIFSDGSNRPTTQVKLKGAGI